MDQIFGIIMAESVLKKSNTYGVIWKIEQRGDGG